MTIQLHDSKEQEIYGSRAPKAKLDEDLRRGFKTAVNNNQARLALEYAVKIIGDLDDKIALLLEKTTTKRPTKVTTSLQKDEVEG